MGIIACGLAYNYIMENFPESCPSPVLKISQYPLPTALVQRMASECRSLLIVERRTTSGGEMIRGLLVLDSGQRTFERRAAPHGQTPPDSVLAPSVCPAARARRPASSPCPGPRPFARAAATATYIRH